VGESGMFISQEIILLQVHEGERERVHSHERMSAIRNNLSSFYAYFPSRRMEQSKQSVMSVRRKSRADETVVCIVMASIKWRNTLHIGMISLSE